MVRSRKKFQIVCSQIRRDILGGKWEVGSKLPAESVMAQGFGCSAGTVSKALALIAHEGLVERRARAGTTVIAASIEKPSAPRAAQMDAFAVIYPSDQHEGIWRTVKGVQDAARDARRRVMMMTTGLDYQKEAEFISRLSEFDVKGAVIYPILTSPHELVQFSHMLVRSKFPVVLAELNLPGLGCSCVVADGFHAGYTMTQHMLSRGAKAIGFFSNFAWAPFMRDRYQGYRWALREAGLAEPEGGVRLETAMRPDFLNPLAEPTTLAEDFLSGAQRLDAVVCADDFLATGCITAAMARGRKVPTDLLVSGIGDYAGLTLPESIPLTTYRIPFEQMGEQAFHLLDQMVEFHSPITKEIQILGEMIVRESA